MKPSPHIQTLKDPKVGKTLAHLHFSMTLPVEWWIDLQMEVRMSLMVMAKIARKGSTLLIVMCCNPPTSRTEVCFWHSQCHTGADTIGTFIGYSTWLSINPRPWLTLASLSNTQWQ